MKYHTEEAGDKDIHQQKNWRAAAGQQHA